MRDNRQETVLQSHIKYLKEQRDQCEDIKGIAKSTTDWMQSCFTTAINHAELLLEKEQKVISNSVYVAERRS